MSQNEPIDALFVCAYCGAVCRVMTQPETLDHPLPVCPQFALVDETDAESMWRFLHAANVKAAKEGKMPQ
jgi:hypothetical protein